jgi:hypothetical protein
LFNLPRKNFLNKMQTSTGMKIALANRKIRTIQRKDSAKGENEMSIVKLVKFSHHSKFSQ